MPSGSPEWPEARTLRLRALWDEGMPVSEIGRQLGVTLNAVVGKSHRLHLTPRASPIQPAGSGRKPYKRTPHLKPPRPPPLPLAPLASVVAVAALVAETRMPEAPVVARTKVLPISPETPLPVRALGRCQFLNGTRPLSFCDKPCVLNQRGLPSAYCGHHHARCCIRVRDRREDAA